MWALAVLRVHGQLNHLFFRKRKGRRRKKTEERKEGGREIRPGATKAKKERTHFSGPEFGIRLEGWLALPVALLLLADSGYTFPFKTGCLQSRGNKPEPPHKSIEVTAKSFVHLLSLAVINSLHLGTGQRP